MKSAKNAYTAYVAKVGGTTFDGRPLPTFEELGDRQKEGWAAAADSLGMTHKIGQELTTKRGVKGVVCNIGLSKTGKRNYWIEGIDNTGRPFDLSVYEDEVLEAEETA